MKKIKRKDKSDGLVGKPVKVDKLKDDFKMIGDLEEKEAEKDDGQPKLNFRRYSMDPPTVNYQDQGDSVQKKILGRD
jgi:hypothetical protein